jgi:hypothetical protein
LKDERITPVFDFSAGEFVTDTQGNVVTVQGAEAVEQIIIKAQATARGVYLIYAHPENKALHHKYGSDVHLILTTQNITDEVRESELKRAIREAILYDPWIKDVGNITLSKEKDKEGVVMNYASFTVKTIFDKEIGIEGVLLND